MSFADTVDAYCDDAERDMDEIAALSITAFGDRLIVLSPEKTGRFKSNWYYGSGSPSSATNEQTSIRTLNNLGAMPADAAGRLHYVSNAMPQAMRLEYGFVGPDSLGRVYNQPPRPMLGIARIEWPQIFEQTVRRVKP